MLWSQLTIISYGCCHVLMSSWKGSLILWWHVGSCDIQKLWRRHVWNSFQFVKGGWIDRVSFKPKQTLFVLKELLETCRFFLSKYYHQIAVQRWIWLLQVHIYFCQYEWFMQIHAKHILHVRLFSTRFVSHFKFWLVSLVPKQLHFAKYIEVPLHSHVSLVLILNENIWHFIHNPVL